MRGFALRLASVFLAFLLAAAVPAATGGRTEAGAAAVTLNFHSKTFGFKDAKGTLENVGIKNGLLTLADGAESGSFTSDVQDIGSFDYAVASWNARTNGGTISVEMCFELEGGVWSDWYGWGVWSDRKGVSASKDKNGAHASMSVDTLTVKDSCKTTGLIKYRVTLERGDGSPEAANVSFATPQMSEQSSVGDYPAYFLNDVPMRSQLAAENGSVGSIICSPTTTAMALEYMGTRVSSLEAAGSMYDNAWRAYGNWSFAAAYAGENGYVAFIDFYSLEMAKYALSRGVVLGCSTGLTSAGHIVLLTGYDEENDKLLVNDPNISENDLHVTEYDVSYFTERWMKDRTEGLGLVYVFQKDGDLEAFDGQSPGDPEAGMVRIKDAATGRYLADSGDFCLAEPDGTDSQVWRLVCDGNSRYALANAATGRRLSADGGDGLYFYGSDGGYLIRPSEVKDKAFSVDGDGKLRLAGADAAARFTVESVSVEPPGDGRIRLTGANGSQYKIGARMWTEGTFTAIYWEVAVLKPDGEGYTVAAKYACGENKSVAAGEDGIIIAVHAECADELDILRGLEVGDSVSLTGVYPKVGGLAENGSVGPLRS